jgi:hypothetical protein
VKDPHFHEIVHDVRRAIPVREKPFGTVLTLNDDHFMSTLWSKDLDFVPLPDARMVEIFLDAVLAFGASSTSYRLADDYFSALSAADREVSTALKQMIGSIPESAQAGSSWPAVESSLRRLGWKSESSQSSWGGLPEGLE